jgi:hypothetical protein
MKLKFTKENAEDAKKYIGKKVLCLYQDNIDSPLKIGVLESVNTLVSAPFEVDTNLYKILNYFDTIIYDSDLDDAIKSINSSIHQNHCEHKVDASSYNFNYCPICGEKL